MTRAIDIAREAHVSKTTVSYVFTPGKSHLISEETRQKVMAVAARLDYHPSQLGRALSKNRSYHVALVLPLRCTVNMSINLLSMFHGVLSNAEHSDYDVSIFLGAGERLFNQLKCRSMDGILVIGLGADSTMLERLAALEVPMVVANRFFRTGRKLGCVRNDYKSWFYGELLKMHGKGCRRVLVLTKVALMDTCREYGNLAEEWNRRRDGLKVDTMPLSDDYMRQFAELLLSPNRYDGFVIDGSEGEAMARIGAELGVMAGVDFQLTGYVSHTDNAAHCQWFRNSFEIGQSAWQMLLRIIDGEDEPGEILVPLKHVSEGRPIVLDKNMGFDV